jgi:sugar/nucleoside kinase (ribokinase family)
MPKSDAVFVGLTILDIEGRPVTAIPDGGGVTFIDEIRLSPAGAAAEAAMNAAKLGISTAAVACAGIDEKGDFILDVYRQLGIDCRMIQRTETSPTSATILPIRPNGERPAFHCRGASDRFFVVEQDFDAICDARFLHDGGTGLLAAMDQGQSTKLLRDVKKKGLVTTFDLIAPSDNTLSSLHDLLPSVDDFMPSYEEAAFLSHRSNPADAAAFFLDFGVSACIFKMGAQVSYTRTRDGEFQTPAFEVLVSDVTGRRDSYCGGFIGGLAEGLDLKDACRRGAAVSALAATGLGSDAGVRDREQVRAFMETAEPLQ